MSKSYNRRINLYINGKEVKNNISSVQKAMYALTNEQRRMTLGSDEYVEHTKKIRHLKGILTNHHAQLRGTATLWQKTAGVFKKLLPIFSAGAIVAGISKFVSKMNEAINASDNFEERLDNLSALTGLEGRELEELGDIAKKTSVKFTEGGVRIKQSADDIVDAYTKVGSQRPELLKNAEALAAVTEDSIILSEAAKSDLDPAVAGLTTTMNQFNIGAEGSRRIINSMAAGSKEGAADIPYLTQAIEKSGTTMHLMNISLEENIGLIESIAPNYAKAELAGNSLDKVFLKLKEKQIGYKDGVFSVNGALEELETRYNNGESAASIFGVEHAKMGELLVQNKDEFNRYTKAVTGTNIAIEQAAKNTNNAKAIQAQARNEFHNAAIELGKNLSPAMTTLYKVAGSVASAFSKMIATSPVESLRKERTELNSLVMKITSLNEGEEKRLELIKELIRKYPQYYGEIDAATISNNALLTSLRETNRQMVRQIYIAGRKEELADLQEKAAKKLAVEMKYQEDLNSLKTSYFSKMGVEQQEIFTGDFDFMMQHFEKITSMYSSNTKKAMAVSKWLQNNKLSKQYKGGLDYGDMIALNISYTEWKEAYKKKYKAQADAEAEYSKINAYEKKWGIDSGLAQSDGSGSGGSGSGAADPKAEKKLLAALEKTFNEKKTILTQQRANEETSEEQFNSRMLLLEIAHLQAKQAILKNGGKDTSAIDLDIANKKLEITTTRIKKEEELEKDAEKKEKERLDKLKEDYEAVKKLFEDDDDILPDGKIMAIGKIQTAIEEQMAAEILAVENTEYFKTLTVAQQEQERENIRKKHHDRLIAEVQEQALIWMDIGAQVGQMFGNMVSDQEITLKEFGKNMLIFALDILEKQLELAIVAATIQSLSSPESVATFGVAGIAKAAVLIGLMKAAFGAARGLVGNFAAGGYTQGETMYIAGEKGTEWIAPNWMTRNPSTAAIISNLEEMRQKKTSVYPGTQKLLSGSQIQDKTDLIEQSIQSQVDQGIKLLSIEVSKLSKNVEFQAKNPPRLAIDQFEREQKIYNNIISKMDM